MATYDDVSRCQWLFLVYLIVDVPGALSQRPCTDANGLFETSSYFFDNPTTAYPVQYGDCSFGQSLCNYTQFCTDQDAESWRLNGAYPVQYGDCSFGQSLCNYTQFCTDQDAESWRLNGDHAECPGKTGRFESFSVLVSPPLCISHLTCLTFEYTQEPPGMLSVYLATATSLLIIMPEQHDLKQSFIKFTTVLTSTAGKLMFRARSPNVNHSVQLRAVKLQQGSCTASEFVSPKCTFECDELRSSCGWSLNNWNITGQLSAPQSTESIYGATSTGYFAYVVHPSRKGTLTTTLVQATESQTGCLIFSYILCGFDSRLLVSIETVDGNRRVLWSGPPNTATDCWKTWQHAQVPVSSSAAFVIIFENVPSYNNSIVIAVDVVGYTLQPSPLYCTLEPLDAQPRDNDVISSPSSSAQGLSAGISTASYNPETASTSLQLTNGHTYIDQTALHLLSEFQEHASEEVKMAICDDVTWRRWLYLEYLIVCVTGAFSQRPCTDANGFIETSSYFFDNPTTAYPVQYGDCSFGQSLCNYTQFCKDQDAESWRLNGDHAECPGKNGRYDSFSVLVSPPLCISHVTCLTFEYTQEPPGKLSVYLATATSLLIIMPEQLDLKQSFEKFTTVLSSTAGKLMFRARSPNANANQTVQLRAVKLQQGSCTESEFISPTCSFECHDLRSSCGWSLNNWNITRQLSAPQSSESITDVASTGYFADVMYPTGKGMLTTTLVQPTGSQTGCLEFSYVLCGPDSRLLVSIETVDGNRRVLWSGPPSTATDCLKTWKRAQVPVLSSAAFVIIFENIPGYSNSIVIAVDIVRYTLQPFPLYCTLEPPDAQPRVDDVTPWPSSSKQGLSSGISTASSSSAHESEMSSFFPSMSSSSGLAGAVLQSQAEHSNQATPIIAGAVAAVVTVVACIVVLVIIIIIRKRRQKQATGKGANDDSGDDEIANNSHRDGGHPLDGMNMENKKDSEVSSQPEGNYYDIAEDGVPGSTRNRGYILSPGDTKESRSISWNSNKNKKDEYSQVNKQQKVPQEMYAHVHKTQKKTENIGSKQDSRECLNPSYSPETYELSGPQSSKAAATQDDEEYNDLNFEQNRQGDDNCSPGEVTGQMYSHLQGDVLYDCAKAEHTRHGTNMVVDAEYNHLVT